MMSQQYRCRLCGDCGQRWSCVPCSSPCKLGSASHWYGHSWRGPETCSKCGRDGAVLRERTDDVFVCLACLPAVVDTRTLLRVIQIVYDKRKAS